MPENRFINQSLFVVQWHLTEKCNWHCAHCYQRRNDPGELSFAGLKETFSQCLELFRALRIPAGKAHINIGGGEPFLRKDLFNLLEAMNKYNKYIRVQIMTNGSLITDSIAKDLKKMSVKGIQVSLEGLKETNDKIRGEGSFEKTINAIRILKKHKIASRVSLTLTRMNLDDLEDLAGLLKSEGVAAFGIRRYVPLGRGAQLKSSMLSPRELRKYYIKKRALKKKMEGERGEFVITYGCEDVIFCAQNQEANLRACGVTSGCLLNILANGDILPCRRLPIKLGNVLVDRLLDVYFSSAILWNLRDIKKAHKSCRDCKYFKRCLAGAKCISYAYFKDISSPDPQCWRLFKDLPYNK